MEFMQILKYVLIGLEVLASIALIAVVLMQSGKEAGLSSAIAGGSDTYMSRNKRGSWDKKITASTKYIAAVWALLTLGLNLI